MTVTIYITKYALTKGIIETKATLVPGYGRPQSEVFLANCEEDLSRFGLPAAGLFIMQNDYFLLRSDAVMKANKMRCSKIISLKKQIDQLEKLDFN